MLAPVASIQVTSHSFRTLEGIPPHGRSDHQGRPDSLVHATAEAEGPFQHPISVLWRLHLPGAIEWVHSIVDAKRHVAEAGVERSKLFRQTVVVPAPDGFVWTQRTNGQVVITHYGRQAAVLRGERARRFLEEIIDGSEQDLMARLTGNYKRDNERQGRNHQCRM